MDRGVFDTGGLPLGQAGALLVGHTHRLKFVERRLAGTVLSYQLRALLRYAGRIKALSAAKVLPMTKAASKARPVRSEAIAA